MNGVAALPGAQCLGRGALTICRGRAELERHLHGGALGIDRAADCRRRSVMAVAAPVTGVSGGRHRRTARSGLVPFVNRKNGVPTAPPWQAAPSTLNGFAVHDEEIGSRTSAWPAPLPVGVSGMLLWSSTNVGLAAVHEVTGEAHRPRRGLLSPRHVRRVAGERDVRSSRVDARESRSGCRRSRSGSAAVGVATNRDTNICL